MSSRTPNQEKALAWYSQNNGLKPQLSAHPVYYFIDKSGKEVKMLINHIMADWERMRKENSQ